MGKRKFFAGDVVLYNCTNYMNFSCNWYSRNSNHVWNGTQGMYLVCKILGYKDRKYYAYPMWLRFNRPLSNHIVLRSTQLLTHLAKMNAGLLLRQNPGRFIPTVALEHGKEKFIENDWTHYLNYLRTYVNTDRLSKKTLCTPTTSFLDDMDYLHGKFEEQMKGKDPKKYITPMHCKNFELTDIKALELKD